MSKEKNTEKEVAEVTEAIKDSLGLDELRDSIAELKKSFPKKEKKEKMTAKVASPYDAYGVDRKQANDLTEDKWFDADVVKKYAGEQKTKEDKDAKNYIFWKALYARHIDPYEPKYNAVLKALSEGTAADGGYLVTPEYRTEVLRQLHLNGTFRPEVNVIPVNTDSVNFNSEDGRPTVSWGSENTTISTTTAGLAQTTISVYRMNSLMYLSREVVADSSPSIVSWITDEFVESVRNEEDAVIATGSGSGRPKGLSQISGFGSRVNDSSLTFSDFVTLQHTLAPQYRINNPNCKWYMHDNLLRDTRNIEDDNGRPLYQVDLTSTTPGTLLGSPIVVSNNLPEKTVFYGDLKRTYILLDRQSLSVDTTTEGAGTFEKHQLAIKITERIGGDAVRKEGLVKGLLYSA